MGLHAIDASGRFTWHCANPDCAYHNCAGWHSVIECAHHSREQATIGSALVAHISHADVTYISADLVALPACACGARCFVKVRFSARELAAENMTVYELRPGLDDKGNLVPTRTAVGPHPMIELHRQLDEHLRRAGKRPPEEGEQEG